ncbi:hypothetical protein GCM10010112_03090 [Actinoplanes lobatus]|uniref:Uncharacterized protein n=1 Tax=Actinoplanes lobatus TaxID=113568 RepID=A0A7W7MDZ9_9ACTN|nr:hypothetical protein [Actinoplanes lobatus]MBB4746731.1 hypothetical protein [Actinoplanes lobatus]GGN53859.1 hypothetical protein GCM10010112_03090 [Actinoplanes lobatus]GIE38797.1 hypothetical protein Alo02nite_16950 [Actinoplanes lobatus]
MRITPPRGTGGTTTTRSVRVRNRRRQNAATDARYVAGNQPELAPPRRRPGRHAAEPEVETPTGPGLPDVESRAPESWDPWAAAEKKLPAASITDPLEGSGVVDARAFWSGAGSTSQEWTRTSGSTSQEWADTSGHAAQEWAGTSGHTTPEWTDTSTDAVQQWTDTSTDGVQQWTDTSTDGVQQWEDAGGYAAPEWTDTSTDGVQEWSGSGGNTAESWAGAAESGFTGGWERAAGTGDNLTGSWIWPAGTLTGAGTAPDAWATGTGAVEGLPVRGWESDGTAAAPGLRDEPAGGVSLHGEAGARDTYPERRELELRPAGRRRTARPARARRAPGGYLVAALVRCGLYLGPLSLAVAGAESLGRVAWPVPAATLLLGWTAAQGLAAMGVSAARRGGPAAAARMVASGFAAVIGIWFALVWVAPDVLLGPDRALAATVGLGGLISLGCVTAALVTRAEASVAAWFTPCWLLAAATLADSAGLDRIAAVPVETLLPAAIVAVTVRAFRPAVLGRTTRPARLDPAERRRGVAYLVIGAAQAVSVVLLWRGGPAAMPVPAVLPLLVAVPVLEGLIGWHTARLDAGLDSAETPEEFDRHVRNVTAITLAGLVPPLAAGCGLLLAAYRLPYGLAGVPGASDAVLALAAGTLLGGVFAVTFLLAARSRHGIAAVLAAFPPIAAAVLAMSAPPEGMLPAAVAVLAATHLAGLLIVALTAADLRRTP